MYINIVIAYIHSEMVDEIDKTGMSYKYAAVEFVIVVVAVTFTLYIVPKIINYLTKSNQVTA